MYLNGVYLQSLATVSFAVHSIQFAALFDTPSTAKLEPRTYYARNPPSYANVNPSYAQPLVSGQWCDSLVLWPGLNIFLIESSRDGNYTMGVFRQGPDLVDFTVKARNSFSGALVPIPSLPRWNLGSATSYSIIVPDHMPTIGFSFGYGKPNSVSFIWQADASVNVSAPGLEYT